MRLTDEQILEVEYNRGKYDGIKEVVELLESDSDILFNDKKWQAKLEEWGIK